MVVEHRPIRYDQVMILTFLGLQRLVPSSNCVGRTYWLGNKLKALSVESRNML